MLTELPLSTNTTHNCRPDSHCYQDWFKSWHLYTFGIPISEYDIISYQLLLFGCGFFFNGVIGFLKSMLQITSVSLHLTTTLLHWVRSSSDGTYNESLISPTSPFLTGSSLISLIARNLGSNRLVGILWFLQVPLEPVVPY